jgi:hypothetical protein
MRKVVPFIETIGNDKFKQFLIQSFSVEMLKEIFDGWRGKDMGSWYKYTNQHGVVLELYPTQYIIVFPKGVKYTQPLPVTLNDFINDMLRFGVELYWGEYMDMNFEPKDYFHKDEIRDYFVDLLTKMGKSHELL